MRRERAVFGSLNCVTVPTRCTVGACGHCGESLDRDTRTDDALQTPWGACVDAARRDAAAARLTAFNAARLAA